MRPWDGGQAAERALRPHNPVATEVGEGDDANRCRREVEHADRRPRKHRYCAAQARLGAARAPLAQAPLTTASAPLGRRMRHSHLGQRQVQTCRRSNIPQAEKSQDAPFTRPQSKRKASYSLAMIRIAMGNAYCSNRRESTGRYSRRNVYKMNARSVRTHHWFRKSLGSSKLVQTCGGTMAGPQTY